MSQLTVNPTVSPKVSIAVLSWNSKQITRDCLESIVRHVTGVTYELIVIENGSHDGSAEMIRQEFNSDRYPQIVTVFNQDNLGFAGGNNQAYAKSRGEYFLLLNSDTIVYEQSIERMVEFLDQHADYGGVTTKLLNPDKSVQYYMHRRFPNAWSLLLALVHKRWRWFRPPSAKRYLYLDNDFSQDFDINQAAGACLMVRRSCIEQVGGLLDETHFPLYYNDVEFCYRLHQHGFTIRCLCTVAITHLKGTSVRTLDFFKNGKEYAYASLWFFKKHHQPYSYWTLKVLYILLFGVLNSMTPFLLLTKKITPDQAKYRWSILPTIITLRR